MGSVRAAVRRGDEGVGAVAGVQEVRAAAEAHGVGAPDDRGLDGLGGPARHALVSADAVDREGAQADARGAVLQERHPRSPLIRELVDAVVGVRSRGRVLAGGAAGAILVLALVDRRARRVGDPPDPALGRLLEDVHRPKDVHHRPGHGVRAAEGDLEPGEVDDVIHLVLVHAGAEGRRAGDIALHERDARQRFRAQEVTDPPRLRAEVEDHRVVALLEEALDDPGADAAEGSGDEVGALTHGPLKLTAERGSRWP